MLDVGLIAEVWQRLDSMPEVVLVDVLRARGAVVQALGQRVPGHTTPVVRQRLDGRLVPVHDAYAWREIEPPLPALFATADQVAA